MLYDKDMATDSDNVLDEFAPVKKSQAPVKKPRAQVKKPRVSKVDLGIFKCKICQAPFTRKSNCARHEAGCGPNRKTTAAVLSCPNCKASFCRKDHLKQHLKKCKGSLSANPSQLKTKTPCLIKDCDFEFFHKTSLIQHLKMSHKDEVTIEPMVSKTFSSIKEFNSWKEKEEESKFSYFPARHGQEKSSVKHYYCQQDGSAKPHSDRKSSRCNKKGRVKSGHCCLAKITARVDENGTVHVEYYPTHSHACKKEDIRHHPLPDVMSRYIDEKLSDKMSPSVVYDLVKERFLPQSNPLVGESRAAIVTKKRIVERGRRKHTAQRFHKDDAKSVYLMAAQMIKSGEDSLLIYKPYNDCVVYGPKEIDQLPNSKELFMFAFQTETQKELMNRHTTKILIVGETHGTNQFKYGLVTAMVVDENHCGRPVGHLITSKSDTDSLKFFFSSLKSRLSEDVRVSCVITDDDQALLNAISVGISEDFRHLLCKWHVFKNLKENLMKKVCSDLFDTMISEIKLIMNAQEENEFKTLIAGFEKKYDKNKSASKFLTYFQTTYWKRPEKWAMCYRNFPHAEVNTTGHIDSFHGRLKKDYLKRKVNKRLDDLINILFNVDWENHCSQAKEAMNGLAAQPEHILERHQQGLLIEDEAIIEQVSDRLWEVTSATGNINTYVVERFEEACVSDCCFSKCLEAVCHGLCAHLFHCSCPDFHPLCKHIHKLQSFLMKGETRFTVDEEDFYIYPYEELDAGNHDLSSDIDMDVQETSTHEGNWQAMVERLQSGLSTLQEFLNEAQQKNVPEHTLSHVDAIVSDLVRNLRATGTENQG